MNSIEENKKNALLFIKCIGSQDLSTLSDLYAQDGMFWQNGHKLEISGAHKPTDIAEAIIKLFARLPKGMKFEILSVTAEENRVSVEATSEAVMDDGQEYKNQYHFMFIFNEDGKLSWVKEYWDTLYAHETLYRGELTL